MLIIFITVSMSHLGTWLLIVSMYHLGCLLSRCIILVAMRLYVSSWLLCVSLVTEALQGAQLQASNISVKLESVSMQSNASPRSPHSPYHTRHPSDGNGAAQRSPNHSNAAHHKNHPPPAAAPDEERFYNPMNHTPKNNQLLDQYRNSFGSYSDSH